MDTPQSIDWPTIIPGVMAFLGAVTLYLQNRGTQAAVKENTTITQTAADAAQSVQAATVDRLDYDRLRRMEAALLTLAACDDCRAAIMALTERRRLTPAAPQKDSYER